jgi:hypothetical protein
VGLPRTLISTDFRVIRRQLQQSPREVHLRADRSTIERGTCIYYILYKRNLQNNDPYTFHQIQIRSTVPDANVQGYEFVINRLGVPDAKPEIASA